MTSTRAAHWLALAGALFVSLARVHDATACSCAGPRIALLGPTQIDDAPLNTRVRVEMPDPNASRVAGGGLVVRAHGGAVVPTTSRSIAPGRWLATLELTPNAPLAPATRYEVAVVDPTAHPSVTVLGTFKTGTTTDATAPRLDALGVAHAVRNPHPIGSMCQVAGPWIVLDGVAATDPGRADAKLVFGVWLGDAAGNVDANKPPTAIRRAHEGRLHLGQSSACDPYLFPLPAKGVVWLGIAALDEAGNASTMRKVKVDLDAARSP